MFGKTPSREFFIPVDVTDSLNFLWENDIYGTFPNSSVSVYDELVFVNDLSGRIFCFNINDGKEIGKIKYDGAVYSTPIPFKTTIVFPVASDDDDITELIFYDYLNGKELELIEIPGRVLTEMIAVKDDFIFTTEHGTVFRYDLNREKIWETGTNKPTRSSPAMKDDILVFGNDSGEIIALNSTTGDSVYARKIGGQFYSGITINENIIYAGNENGFLYAMKLENGEILWQYETGSRILMTPAVDDKNVVFGNLAGELFSLDKKTGKLNWQAEFDGVLNTTPMLTNNLIILPDVLFSFHIVEKENGKILRTVPLNGRAKLSPVYFHNLLFIGFDDGILRAYEFVQ
jgi:outer membrane protein assembly factor BamB